MRSPLRWSKDVCHFTQKYCFKKYLPLKQLILHVCLPALIYIYHVSTWMPGVHRGLRKGLYVLEQVIQMVASYWVYSGNWAQVVSKSSSYRCHWVISLAPTFPFMEGGFYIFVVKVEVIAYFRFIYSFTSWNRKICNYYSALFNHVISDNFKIILFISLFKRINL